QPFIAHQLKLFRREGITKVVLCVGHLFEQIYEFVGGGDRFGLSVSYSLDGPTLLGTGGALKKSLPNLGPEFLVTYGASYLDISYAPVVEAFRASGRPALMTVLHNQNRWDASNVEFADGRIIHYSKAATRCMSHIDYGLSVFKAEVFEE